MKDEIIQLENYEKLAKPRKVFRVSNGKVDSRAIRDFHDSPLAAGDLVDLYRVTRKHSAELYPGDVLIRKADTHVIG